jgi:hypothetical protein
VNVGEFDFQRMGGAAEGEGEAVKGSAAASKVRLKSMGVSPVLLFLCSRHSVAAEGCVRR